MEPLHDYFLIVPSNCLFLVMVIMSLLTRPNDRHNLSVLMCTLNVQSLDTCDSLPAGTNTCWLLTSGGACCCAAPTHSSSLPLISPPSTLTPPLLSATPGTLRHCCQTHHTGLYSIATRHNGYCASSLLLPPPSGPSQLVVVALSRPSILSPPCLLTQHSLQC